MRRGHRERERGSEGLELRQSMRVTDSGAGEAGCLEFGVAVGEMDDM